MFRGKLFAAGVLGLAISASVMASGAEAAVQPAAQPAAVSCPAVGSGGVLTPAPSPGVDWSGCDLRGANLDGADLSGANLTGVDLYQVQASGATFSHADLSSAELDSAGLSDADLDGATLAGADLTWTEMTDANLTSADVNGANLQYTNMTGSVVTGATFVDDTWVHVTCPDGTNSDAYVDGCFSALDTTPPSAAPSVASGTAGAHGWYISPVTVYWNWTDNGKINPTDCTAESYVSANGATTLTATCADVAGNIGHASFTVRVDTTAPTAAVTGVRAGHEYVFGHGPAPACRTSDPVSGVARPAKLTVTTNGSNGVGGFTATCSGAVSVAGTRQAGSATAKYSVVYGFGGFMSPRPGSTLSKTTRTILATFRLTTAAGRPISASRARYLAATRRILVNLKGPGIGTATATCAWSASAHAFRCVLKVPAGVRTGRANRYAITAFEKLGTGVRPVPPAGKAANPETIYFR
jgi:hypothetical protein